MSYDQTTGINQDPLNTNPSMSDDPGSRTFAEDEFECPRCHQQLSARFYGPCVKCSVQLREKYLPSPTEVEVEKFEPKMNVTPNAVATKD